MLSVVSVALIIASGFASNYNPYAGYYSNSNSATNHQCAYAIAAFDDIDGVEGQIEIDTKGHVIVDLNVDNSVRTKCSDGGKEFSYHIHEKWDYADSKARLGATECGATKTGGMHPFIMHIRSSDWICTSLILFDRMYYAKNNHLYVYQPLPNIYTANNVQQYNTYVQ